MKLRRVLLFCLLAFTAIFATSACMDGLREASAANRALQSGNWETFASLPTAVQEIGVAVLNSIIYVVGGITEDRLITNLVQAYNPDADTWELVDPLPIRLHHVAVVAANEKLYAIGGYVGNFQPRRTLIEYDPQVNTWQLKAEIPVALGSAAAAVIDNTIYVTGGQGEPGQQTLYAYDIQSDSWTRLANMPTGRNHHAAVAVDGKLYVAGGRLGPQFTLDSFEVYDPTTDAWSVLPPMPTGRSGIAAAVVRGCIFVFGGEGNARSVNALGVFEENEVYNPNTNSWSAQTSMPFPRHGIGAAAINNIIHLPGGGPVEGFGVTAEHDGFVPDASVDCS